jgi:Polysaccharide biosynthesis enzyme WcbI
LEQKTPQVRLLSGVEFPSARRVTFPSLDINVIWPLRAQEKRIFPEPPLYPWGRYTYGDRAINEAVARGLKGDAAWEFYQERSAELVPNMTRLLQIERQRWEFAERELDVKMSDLVFPQLATSRLFWTYNHPRRDLLWSFGARILVAAGVLHDENNAIELMKGAFTWEFGSDYQQPIHPKVADALGLAWWSPDMKYRRHDVEFDYETFIRNQIEWA